MCHCPLAALIRNESPAFPILRVERHQAENLGMVEAVPLDVIGAPGEEWPDQLGQVCRVHLVVRVHLHADVDPLLQGVPVPRQHGASNALVDVMGEELDPRIGHGAHSQEPSHPGWHRPTT